MNPTTALLRKDLPWLLFFLVGGTLGLALAVCTHSFWGFVVAVGSRDEVFHVAWSCGMGLGIVAFAFDEVLGTREFLAQRPVGAAAVMRARLLGCALVLGGWMLLAPALAYLLLVFESAPWQWGHWQQLPTIWGTMLPAWSACALAALATSLPFAWWVRLLGLGALFVLSFSVIFWCERESARGLTSWPVFVGGHGAVALGATALAWRVRGLRRDPDQPLAAGARRAGVVPMLVVGALTVAGLLMILAGNAIGRLRACFPRVVRHDGAYQLAVRPEWRGPWILVGSDHAPTGQILTAATDIGREGRYFFVDEVRIEGPRDDLGHSATISAGELLVDADGTPWWAPRDAPLHRLEKSSGEPCFARGAYPKAFVLGPDDNRSVLVLERGSDAAWRFDASTARFDRLALAAGDRIDEVEYLRPSSNTSLAFEPGFVPTEREDLIRGEQFAYSVRNSGLVKVASVQVRDDEKRRNGVLRLVASDGLGWTLEVAPTEAGGAAMFRHDFAPRTPAECFWAATACLMSAVRPPVLQLPAAFAPANDLTPGPQQRWQWLLDPLIVAGRRWWLVALGIALAALLTRVMRRRLRHLGADAATIRFWSGATLLLGVFGAWACLWCERPRRWADRSCAAPVPAPRLVSPHPVEQSVA